ncbi:hypothetical protein B0H13DRAFT_2375260 [Mycena leptocephala]|nr:hypothetical protein B0H13DRAFT_2375260 [Mycena leptocephala]
MSAVPSPWPSPEIIHHLVDKSSGYFVYASTVVKFVDDKDYRPSERLEIITGLAESTSGSPFAALDQLYSQILSAATRPQLLQILALLELKRGDLRLALCGLHSVISVDEGQDKAWITQHHASFCDYLQDSTRSGVFHVGPQQRIDLALLILKAFSRKTDDPDLNAEGVPVASMCGTEVLEYIAKAPPVSTILSALESLNPDFLFRDYIILPSQVLLDWLKDIQPSPLTLIALWDDLDFMAHCERVWGWGRPSNYAANPSHNYALILAQSPPALARILQVTKIAVEGTSLTFIRLVLHLSWTEMREAICYLRPIIGKDGAALLHLHKFRFHPIFPYIAHGYLRIAKCYLDHTLPRPLL